MRIEKIKENILSQGFPENHGQSWAIGQFAESRLDSPIIAKNRGQFLGNPWAVSSQNGQIYQGWGQSSYIPQLQRRSITMNHQEYQALCSQHPTLTSEGFGVNMEYAEGLSREEYLAVRRRELEEAFQEFSYCVDWLQTHDIEGKWNAHYWKDQVQSEFHPKDGSYFHIPRGVFILAALSRGFKVRKIPESTDAWISNPNWSRVARLQGGRTE